MAGAPAGTASVDDSRRVSSYLASFRRHRLLFAAMMAVGVLGGLVVSKLAPAQYTAFAAVLVTPNGVNDPNPADNRAPGGVDLDTEIQLAQSNQVSQDAAATLGVSPGTVSARTLVVVPANSRVLRIGYLGQTPAASARGANAVAAAYLKDRTANAQATLTAQLARRADQIAALQAQLKATVDHLSTLQPSDLTYTYTQSQVQVLTSQVALASRNRAALATLVVTPGVMLNQAVPPTKASGSTRKQHLFEGVLLGFILACGAVHVADRQRRRVRTEQDLHELLPPAALVLVNHRGAAATEGAEELAADIVSTLPHGGVVEFRTLRTGHRAELVLEAARHLAAAGYDVTVAAWPGARLDDTSVLTEGRLANGEGVAEIVLNAASRRGALSTWSTGADSAVIAGPSPENSGPMRVFGQGQLLDGARAPVNDVTMRRRFDLVRGTADYLLVLGPERKSYTGGLNDQADGVVLVTRAHRTLLREVAGAATRSAVSPSGHVGAVLQPSRFRWRRGSKAVSTAKSMEPVTAGR